MIDMLNDFMTGSLGCDRAKEIVESTKLFLEEARKHDVPIIFCNDSHFKGVDKEFKIMGISYFKGNKRC